MASHQPVPLEVKKRRSRNIEWERDQLETARTAPDPEPIRQYNVLQIVFIVTGVFVSRRVQCKPG